MNYSKKPMGPFSVPPKTAKQSIREKLECVELSTDYAPGRHTAGGSGVFMVRYSARCPCGELIRPGDRARFINEDMLVHEGCDGTEVPLLETAEQIMGMGAKEIAQVRANLCKTCFLVKLPSGICGTCG